MTSTPPKTRRKPQQPFYVPCRCGNSASVVGLSRYRRRLPTEKSLPKFRANYRRGLLRLDHSASCATEMADDLAQEIRRRLKGETPHSTAPSANYCDTDSIFIREIAVVAKKLTESK